LRIAALAALAFLAASTILPPLARADTAPAAADPAATPSLDAMQVKLDAALKEQRFLAGQVEELKDQLSRRNQQIADLSAQLEAALRQAPVAATAMAKPAGMTPLAVAAGALVTAQKKAAETSSAGLDARSGLATVLVAIVLFTLWGMVRSRRASQLSRRPGG
jgi:transposase